MSGSKHGARHGLAAVVTPLATLAPSVVRGGRSSVDMYAPSRHSVEGLTRYTRRELAIDNRCGTSCFAVRYVAAASVEVDKMAPMTVEFHSSMPNDMILLTCPYTRNRPQAGASGGGRILSRAVEPRAVADS